MRHGGSGPGGHGGSGASALEAADPAGPRRSVTVGGAVVAEGAGAGGVGGAEAVRHVTVGSATAGHSMSRLGPGDM